MTQRGFACNELPIAMLLLWLLIGIGVGVSKLAGLHGLSALAPPAALVWCAVLAVIAINMLDARRTRRRE